MNKDGFIATSLIYSFFLVFISILAVLVSSFIANKTILIRYNEDILAKKNRDTFTINFVTHGSENFKIIYDEKDGNKEKVTIQGQTLTNLIQDSKFVNNEGRWVTSGTANFSANRSYAGKSGALMNNPAVSASILQKNIMSTYNDKYYFSVEYASNSNFSAYLANSSTASKINLPSTGLNWKRLGKTYTETNTTTGPYNIFYIQALTRGTGYFTNPMLIDLTEHYTRGREPEADWMDENIKPFNGTINYLKIEYLERNEEVIIKMITTQKNFRNVRINSCQGKNGKWNMTGNTQNQIKYDSQEKKYYSIFTFKNISDDIDCDLEWY